ncbi:MAG: response regulator [Candidatus Magnetoovum sp. WYHC-5]|nr:response regulator [Candidatus Magnetoovum sp. WYHC-5]
MPNKETKPIILCIDDEQDVLDSLYDTFMNRYEVKTATNGQEAMRIFDESDISIVITDQRMPDMEGTKILKQINEKKPTCKKILLTGYSDISAAIDAINTGSIDRYFNKPWDNEELLMVVEYLISAYNHDKFLEHMEQDIKYMETKNKIKDEELALLKNFIECYVIGVCLINTNSEIILMNQNALEILGYKDLNAVKGKKYNEVFMLDDNKKKEFLQKCKDKDMSFGEIKAITSDGTKIKVQINIIFNKHKNYELIGILVK